MPADKESSVEEKTKGDLAPAVWTRASKLVASARWRSKVKGYTEFDLTVAYVAEKIAGNRCEATGLPFELGRHGYLRRNPWAPSLSRRDHTGPYVRSNVDVTTVAYNILRGELDEQSMLLLAMQLLRKRGMLD